MRLLGDTEEINLSQLPVSYLIANADTLSWDHHVVLSTLHNYPLIFFPLSSFNEVQTILLPLFCKLTSFPTISGLWAKPFLSRGEPICGPDSSTTLQLQNIRGELLWRRVFGRQECTMLKRGRLECCTGVSFPVAQNLTEWDMFWTIRMKLRPLHVNNLDFSKLPGAGSSMVPQGSQKRTDYLNHNFPCLRQVLYWSTGYTNKQYAIIFGGKNAEELKLE